jgi:hypothetical protein
MPESSTGRYRDHVCIHESAKIVRGHDHACAVYATARLVDVLAHPISVVNVCRRFWKFVYSSALPRRHTELVTDLFLADGAARGEVGLSFGNRLECVRLGQTASLHPLRPDPRWLRRSQEPSRCQLSLPRKQTLCRRAVRSCQFDQRAPHLNTPVDPVNGGR